MENITLREYWARQRRTWLSTQSKEVQLRDKLYKRYKIRTGTLDWAECGDAARKERLTKFVQHYKKETGVTITFNVEPATHKPPYAVSFFGLEGGVK